MAHEGKMTAVVKRGDISDRLLQTVKVGRLTSLAHQVEVTPVGLGVSLLVTIFTKLVGVVLGDGGDGGEHTTVQGELRCLRRSRIGHEERLSLTLLLVRSL